MAFTRKFLKALGLEDNIIDTLIEEHTAVTTALTRERDDYKAKADTIPGLQKQLEDAQGANDGKDYKTLYNDLVKANEAKEARAGKVSGYKEILKSAGIAEKHWPLILAAKGAEIDKLELTDGKVKGAEALVEALKKELPDYISTTNTEGADTSHHPDGNTGGGKDLGEMSMEDYIAARTKK